MAISLRRPSVPRLNKYFQWLSKKEITDARVIEEIGARAVENREWRKDITDVPLAQDKASITSRAIRLTPSNSTHDLAVFLRTTGPRGRGSLRVPSSTGRRSKSLPRRLLGRLCEYWKPIDEEDGLPASNPYKYDGRLQAWVCGLPIDATQQSSPEVPDSVVQRTTSKGQKYFELKGPPSPRTDGVFSRGDDWSSIYEKPLADELDRIVLCDLTSDDLMDSWLADPGEKLDSCSDSAHHSFPPSPIVSAAGLRLSLLLPSTQADDSVVASKTLAPTRASSTICGRLSIWAPAALSRDSVSMVFRHPGAASESQEWDGNMRLVTDDRRASLWEPEDTGMQDVDDTPIPGIGNETHTFYTSDDSDLDAPIGIPPRERRDTEPSSGRTDINDDAARVSHSTRSGLSYVKTSECVVCDLCIKGAGQGAEVVARNRSNDARTGGSTLRTNATRTSDEAAPAQAISPMPFTYRPTGPFSPEIDLIDMKRARARSERPRHVQPEELLGRAGPNAWNQTKLLPKAPVSVSTKNGIRASDVHSDALVREKGDWDELFMDYPKGKLFEPPEALTSSKAKYRRNVSAATP
ncbi:hypothetical protein LTS12_026608 [Elasticomyces elasticus]|nr:hypothetical protein LTS12_026608 [Elasticomyces elasticus]